jgi:hypothetical protein
MPIRRVSGLATRISRPADVAVSSEFPIDAGGRPSVARGLVRPADLPPPTPARMDLMNYTGPPGHGMLNAPRFSLGEATGAEANQYPYAENNRGMSRGSPLLKASARRRTAQVLRRATLPATSAFESESTLIL